MINPYAIFAFLILISFGFPIVFICCYEHQRRRDIKYIKIIEQL